MDLPVSPPFTYPPTVHAGTAMCLQSEGHSGISTASPDSTHVPCSACWMLGPGLDPNSEVLDHDDMKA